MTATVVLVTLLLAPAAGGSAAAPAACEVYARSTPTPPPLVREWLAHSADERVVMCPQPGAPGSGGATALYFGEGAPTQHGTVCTYPRHGLTLTGSGAAAHLQRYDRSEALAMALAGPEECPAPHAPTSAQGYVETYDISTSTFVGIMRLWSSIAAVPPAASGVRPGSAAGGTPTPVTATRARLQAALGSRTSEATVSRIVRIPGSALRHRYALFVKAPDASGGASSQYVIYVDKSLRGPYEITAFAETN
ncbi:MAG TPA: hypothetical protein VGG67_08170 [Steroidobacteraceae bacterium]